MCVCVCRCVGVLVCVGKNVNMYVRMRELACGYVTGSLLLLVKASRSKKHLQLRVGREQGMG